MRPPHDLGALGSRALSVFHDWNPHRLFVIITVYMDESGTHTDSPVMVLGGRVAKLGQWIDFDHKWRRLLKRYDLPYFHGTEFRSRTDTFRGWTPEKCNLFLNRAQKIIGQHTLCGFGVTLSHAEYKGVYRNLERPRKVKVDGKYGLCFRLALVELPRLIRRSLPDKEITIHFVLESGDPGSGDAKVIFDDAKKTGPEELTSLLGTISYGDKAEFPGLQAADLLAFGAYRNEQTGDVPVVEQPKGYTIATPKEASYKSPAYQFPITPAVMREFAEKGIAEQARRRAFWESRSASRASSHAE